MRFSTLLIFLAATVSVSALRHAGTQTSAPDEPPFTKDSSYIGPDGTAYVTRVVPVPDTISPEARHALARRVSNAPSPQTVEENRRNTLEWHTRQSNAARAQYPLKSIENSTIAGVPVLVLTPIAIPVDRQARVLINLHGGGFVVDAGSLTETIPIANLTQTKVIAVLYRLAPEHPYPAALDDAIAVYKEVLKTNRPSEIAIYGTSAGAILTAQAAAKIKQAGLPMPGAMGIFSGSGDFSRNGDSRSLYALGGFSGHLDVPKNAGNSAYLGEHSRTDPIISPMFSDLHGLPPTLFVTSGRDMLLSGTINLHRAYLRAGVDAQLVVFEGLGHAFWNNPEFPESTEANQIMADFFNKNLGK